MDFVSNGFNKLMNGNILTVRLECHPPPTNVSPDPASPVQYHVAAGATYSNQLTNGQMIPTLDAPYNLSVTIAAGTVSINAANVTQADIAASNGVLHIINGVLVPPNFALPTQDIVALAQNTSSLSTLVKAVVTAGLVSALQVRDVTGGGARFM